MLNSPAFGLIGIGFYLAILIVGPTLLGRVLDDRFGTEPALTLLFLVLGLIVGFYGAYRRLLEVVQRSSRKGGGEGPR